MRELAPPPTGKRKAKPSMRDLTSLAMGKRAAGGVDGSMVWVAVSELAGGLLTGLTAASPTTSSPARRRARQRAVRRRATGRETSAAMSGPAMSKRGEGGGDEQAWGRSDDVQGRRPMRRMPEPQFFLRNNSSSSMEKKNLAPPLAMWRGRGWSSPPSMVKKISRPPAIGGSRAAGHGGTRTTAHGKRKAKPSMRDLTSSAMGKRAASGVDGSMVWVAVSELAGGLLTGLTAASPTTSSPARRRA
ncbi:unnamed protein product [Urochloa humidicola]